jgi:pyruvate/2-oxoglutarate dehydrogenase complex dihydrolipoamide acyltransferase (E2) component
MSEISASPSTRKLALQKGVDLEAQAKRLGRTTIGPEDLDGGAPGTGGDTSYWDVDHSQYGPVTVEPMSRFAQVAARNLAAAQALIPAVTHHDRADVTAIEGLRSAWKGEAEARGVKLTSLAFHVAALARTLRAFPRFNASLSADGEMLTLKGYVHIGIAVDTPHGLMVPVIRDADRKGLWAIAEEIARPRRPRAGPQTRPRPDGRRIHDDQQSRRDRRDRLHPHREPTRGRDPRDHADGDGHALGRRQTTPRTDGAPGPFV